MGTKPGLIGNGRKKIFAKGALQNFAKDCALQMLSLDKRKSARFEMGRPVLAYRVDQSSWTNPATRQRLKP
jgi:hypothetical protein